MPWDSGLGCGMRGSAEGSGRWCWSLSRRADRWFSGFVGRRGVSSVVSRGETGRWRLWPAIRSRWGARVSPPPEVAVFTISRASDDGPIEEAQASKAVDLFPQLHCCRRHVIRGAYPGPRSREGAARGHHVTTSSISGRSGQAPCWAWARLPPAGSARYSRDLRGIQSTPRQEAPLDPNSQQAMHPGTTLAGPRGCHVLPKLEPGTPRMHDGLAGAAWLAGRATNIPDELVAGRSRPPSRPCSQRLR